MPWANFDANFEIKAPCQISTVSDAEASEEGVSAAALRGRFPPNIQRNSLYEPNRRWISNDG